jgi:ribosomal protein S20
MSDHDPKAEWIERVLGVSVSRPGMTGPGDAEIRTIWRNAKASVNAGLAQLAQKLQATGDVLLEQIAREGIPAVGKERNAALESALLAYEQAPLEQQEGAANAVRAAAQAYRSVLAQQATFRLIDENPFGIRIAMREDLDMALLQIERLLAAEIEPTASRRPA